MKRIPYAVLLLLVAGAGPALADERVVIVRSQEDPNVTPDLSVCAAAPFVANVRLTASLWSVKTRNHTGEVKDDSVKQVGEAHACAQITSFAFPPGLQQNFYARFDLPGGSYTMLGTCTLVSNDVPEAGLVLAGCALKVLSGPQGVQGGMASSSSVFNPFMLPGYATGSYWNLYLYDEDTPDHPGGGGHGPGHGHGHGRGHGKKGHALELFEDLRTPAQVERAKQAVQAVQR